MNQVELLLFGGGRWALSPRCILQVEGVNELTNSDSHELSEWGIDNTSESGAPHLLRMRGLSRELNLLVYGALIPRVFEVTQVHALPADFFSLSPASALVSVGESEPPALLIDPARFVEPRA